MTDPRLIECLCAMKIRTIFTTNSCKRNTIWNKHKPASNKNVFSNSILTDQKSPCNVQMEK